MLSPMHSSQQKSGAIATGTKQNAPTEKRKKVLLEKRTMKNSWAFLSFEVAGFWLSPAR